MKTVRIVLLLHIPALIGSAETLHSFLDDEPQLEEEIVVSTPLIRRRESFSDKDQFDASTMVKRAQDRARKERYTDPEAELRRRKTGSPLLLWEVHTKVCPDVSYEKYLFRIFYSMEMKLRTPHVSPCAFIPNRRSVRSQSLQYRAGFT